MAETIQKTVSIYPKQREFLQSEALFRGFAAGIGSGKSWVGAYDMVRKARRGRLYMVVAPTYTLMADSSFRSLEKVARDLDLIAHISRGTRPYIKLKTGAEILFRSGDEPEHLRGPNLSGIWMDEASLMSRDVYDILIGRLREAGELGWMTATFTPKGKGHWTYKEFATGQENTFMVHAATDENPFNDDRFYATRAAKYTSKQTQQELGGVFLDDGGNHFCPGLWPRYTDIGDAYRIRIAGGIGRTYLVKDCTRIIGLDWALNKVNRAKAKKLKEGVEDKTDFCTFPLCDLTQDGLLFMLDCVNERLRPEAKAPALAAICRRWRPFIVATDSDMISESMLLECRRQRDIPEMKILTPGIKNKIERATAAIIRGENGMIYLPQKNEQGKEEPWCEVMMDALSSFTGIDDEHDDIPDGLGVIGKVIDDLKGDGREEEQFPEVLIQAADRFGW